MSLLKTIAPCGLDGGERSQRVWKERFRPRANVRWTTKDVVRWAHAAFVAVLALFLSGCATVLSGKLHQKESYMLHHCRVYGVSALFLDHPTSNDIPIELGTQIAAALTARGLNATFTEVTLRDLQSELASPTRVPGSVIVVKGKSIVVETQKGFSRPNGISFHHVLIYDAGSGDLVAEYEIRIATGPENFRSAKGGIKSAATTFVAESIDANHRLLAKNP